MNLPNFINFESFNILRHKMRILRLGDFDLDRYRRAHRTSPQGVNGSSSVHIEQTSMGNGKSDSKPQTG